jgi:diacylglycerol kinase family enzyme
MTEQLEISKLRIGAILNTASGTCDENSESQMLEIFQEFGVTPVHIWCGGPEELADAFEEVDNHNLDILVVLGGDGTIRTAALRSKTDGPYLIPLPGGTMNLLPRALYGELGWHDVLKNTLARPILKQVSGGEVKGERFFISGVFGAPALWANVREAVREGDLSRAVEEGKVAMKRMFAEKINYILNKETSGSAEALTVTCPLVATTLDENWQIFEAAAIDVHHAGEALGLATAAAFGKWREDKNITVVRTPTVRVFSDMEMPVILDGETVDIGNELEITFIPHAFRVLVPQPDEILS